MNHKVAGVDSASVVLETQPCMGLRMIALQTQHAAITAAEQIKMMFA